MGQKEDIEILRKEWARRKKVSAHMKREGKEFNNWIATEDTGWGFLPNEEE